jgi:hypothetical protein
LIENAVELDDFFEQKHLAAISSTMSLFLRPGFQNELLGAAVNGIENVDRGVDAAMRVKSEKPGWSFLSTMRSTSLICSGEVLPCGDFSTTSAWNSWAARENGG